MIAQTYCGEEMAPVSTDAGDTRWPVCGPDDGPCPSCLSAHVTKLEARNAELETEVKKLIEPYRKLNVWPAGIHSAMHLEAEEDRLAREHLVAGGEAALLAGLELMMKARKAMELADHEHEVVLQLADKKSKLEAALATAEAQVSRLQAERDAALDERNAYRSGHQDEMHEADELRGRIRELEAKAAAQAGGVVVPELNADSIHPLIQWTPSYRVLTGKTAEAINAWVREHSRTIPASRVLGDEEVAVDAERLVMHQENTALIAKMRCALRSGASDKAIVDALRAQAQTEGVEA